jgi:hypothetical protein
MTDNGDTVPVCGGKTAHLNPIRKNQTTEEAKHKTRYRSFVQERRVWIGVIVISDMEN